MMSNVNLLSSRTRLLLVLLFYYLLIISLLMNSIAMTTTVGLTTIVIWFIQIFPLIIFGPMLHRNRAKTFAWLSFVTLMYFVHAVLVAFDSRRTLVGIVEVAACSGLFISLIIYLRNVNTAE